MCGKQSHPTDFSVKELHATPVISNRYVTTERSGLWCNSMLTTSENSCVSSTQLLRVGGYYCTS